jgi:hypothetical protein
MVLKAFVRLADRKGFLKGHLNTLQDEALQSLMIDEAKEEASIEENRMKYTILAGNVQLYQQLYPAEEQDDGEIEWIIPQSSEEIEMIEEILSGIQSGKEIF